MADGRDVEVWDVHAGQCRDAERSLFEFNPNDNNSGGWLRRKVLEVLPAESVVLDLGCGPGYWRNLFEGMVYNGFDQSKEMLKLAKEIPSPKVTPLDWYLGNARTVSSNLQVECLDMVFMASVLQHNRHEPDKREIVEEVHKVLRPNGYFLLTENTYRASNCPQAVSDPKHTDGYTFTPEGWDEFLLPLGFKRLDYNGESEYLYQKV